MGEGKGEELYQNQGDALLILQFPYHHLHFLTPYLAIFHFCIPSRHTPNRVRYYILCSHSRTQAARFNPITPVSSFKLSNSQAYKEGA